MPVHRSIAPHSEDGKGHALTLIKTNAVELMLLRQIRRGPQPDQWSRARDWGGGLAKSKFLTSGQNP
jgi:hypothetical protein